MLQSCTVVVDEERSNSPHVPIQTRFVLMVIDHCTSFATFGFFWNVEVEISNFFPTVWLSKQAHGLAKGKKKPRISCCDKIDIFYDRYFAQLSTIN